MLLDRHKLRALRTARGISQRELSRRLGLRESVVSAIENGFEIIRIYQIYRLAREMDVAFDDLTAYPLAYGRGEYGQPCPPINYDLRSAGLREPRDFHVAALMGDRTRRRNAIWYRRHSV